MTQHAAAPPSKPSVLTPEERKQQAEAELDDILSNPILQGDVGTGPAQVIAAIFLIIAAGLFAYANTHGMPLYLFSPGHAAVANYEDIATVGEAIGTLPVGVAAKVSLWRNQQLTPGSAFGFHTVNLLYHLMAALAVYGLARLLLHERKTELAALVGGIMYALHPLAAEAVHVMPGRGPMMALLGTALAAMLFLYATGNAAKGLRYGPLAGAWLAFAVALFADLAAAALPIVLLAIDRTRPRIGTRFNRLLVHGSFWALAIAACWAAWANVSDGAARASGSLLNALAHALSLLGHALWPTGLSAWHAPLEPGWPAWLGFAVLLLLLALLLWRRTPLAAALAWTLAFGVAAAMAHGDSRLAEWTAPLSLAGAALGAAWLANAAGRLGPPGLPLAALLAVAVAAAGVATYRRNHVWTEPVELWAHAAEMAPGETRPHAEWAFVLHQRAGKAWREAAMAEREQQAGIASEDTPSPSVKRTEARRLWMEAEDRALSALAEEDNPAWSYLLLGDVLEGVARFEPERGEDLAQLLMNGLEEHPENQLMTLRLARMYQNQYAAHQDREALRLAVEHYERAQYLGDLPEKDKARHATLLLGLRAFREGLEVLPPAPALERPRLRAGVVEEGEAPHLRDLRANFRDGLAAVNEAEAEAASEIRSNGATAAFYAASGVSRQRRGRYLDAALAYYEALRLNPSHADAWRNLGFVKARIGQAEGFVEEFADSAPPLESEAAPGPWHALASDAAAGQEWEAAEIYLAQAYEEGQADPAYWEQLAEFARARGATERATAYGERADTLK